MQRHLRFTARALTVVLLVCISGCTSDDESADADDVSDAADATSEVGDTGSLDAEPDTSDVELDPGTDPDASSDADAQDVADDVPMDVADDRDAELDVTDGTDADEDATDVDVDAGPPGSAGCVDGAGLTEGEHRFMLEGLERRFIVRLPTGYAQDRPWPLILALHPNGGNIGYWDNPDGPRDIRGYAENDAIVIMTEAIGGNWRDYEDLENAPARLETELLYFDEVVGQARTELCVREDNIFAMGFSGGGSFSGVLGCRRTDIRAFAAGGSVIYFDEDACVGEPAAWITIGEGELMGREPFREFWRERGGCEATSMPTEPEPCVAYDACTEGTPVHYCEHAGAHVWPEFGTEALWTFFVDFM